MRYYVLGLKDLRILRKVKYLSLQHQELVGSVKIFDKNKKVNLGLIPDWV